MKKIKVLILEEDILARQAITNILQDTGEFNINGLVIESRDTERTILAQNPDVVLLNIEKMESDGFEVLTRLRIRFPNLPVVLISPRTEEGAEAVVTALKMGAVDFVTKPGHCNNLLFAGRHLAKRIVPIVKAASNVNNRSSLGIKPDERVAGDQQQIGQVAGEEDIELAESAVNILVVGGCSGAPKALFSLIPKLPADLSIPVVIVQHFPKPFTKVLARELNKMSRLEVKEVSDGVELTAGTVWIASGGYHCEVYRDGYRDRLRSHRGPRELGNRPSISALFRSAALHYGAETLGIILSGYGSDGISGAKAIKLAGGKILAQDPQSALVPDLPLSILRAGIADEYYPIEELVNQITSRISKESRPQKNRDYENKYQRHRNFKPAYTFDFHLT